MGTGGDGCIECHQYMWVHVMINPIKLFWNYERKGLYDWYAQRLSSLLILVYPVVIIAASFFVSGLEGWRNFLFSPFMKYLGLVSVFGFLWHAKVGLWVVVSDYIGCRLLRVLGVFGIYAFVWLMLGAYIWIMWGAL